MTHIPEVVAGPVIKADLVKVEVVKLHWVAHSFGSAPSPYEKKIPPISKNDLNVIKKQIFDTGSPQKLSLVIEKLHLKPSFTLAEHITGEVTAEAEAIYVLKADDGTIVLEEEIVTEGKAAFSDPLAHIARKEYAQRYAAIANFDAFRKLLVEKSKSINAKLN